LKIRRVMVIVSLYGHPLSKHVPWEDLVTDECKAQGGNIRFGKLRHLGVGRSTLGHDGDMQSQGDTCPYSLVTYDRDVGCVWERVGQLGSMSKEWTHFPLAAWFHRIGWMTPSAHPQRVTKIETRKSTRQGVHTQGWGTLFQETCWFMGVRDSST
jgi:hypothetical protein